MQKTCCTPSEFMEAKRRVLIRSSAKCFSAEPFVEMTSSGGGRFGKHPGIVPAARTVRGLALRAGGGPYAVHPNRPAVARGDLTRLDSGLTIESTRVD